MTSSTAVTKRNNLVTQGIERGNPSRLASFLCTKRAFCAQSCLHRRTLCTNKAFRAQSYSQHRSLCTKRAFCAQSCSRHQSLCTNKAFRAQKRPIRQDEPSQMPKSNIFCQGICNMSFCHLNAICIKSYIHYLTVCKEQLCIVVIYKLDKICRLAVCLNFPSLVC